MRPRPIGAFPAPGSRSLLRRRPAIFPPVGRRSPDRAEWPVRFRCRHRCDPRAADGRPRGRSVGKPPLLNCTSAYGRALRFPLCEGSCAAHLHREKVACPLLHRPIDALDETSKQIKRPTLHSPSRAGWADRIRARNPYAENADISRGERGNSIIEYYH